VIQRLRDDLARLATEKEATWFAGMILAAWPQSGTQDEDRAEIFSQYLIELLMQYPLFICRQLASVNTGIVSKGPYFRPSISEIRRFADDLTDKHERHLRQLRDEARREQEVLEGYHITPQERQRRIDISQRLTKVMRDTAMAIQRASAYAITPVQYDGHELDAMRLQGLENIAAMSKGDSMKADDDGR
jgi:hypothetical protein